jgi:WD40-like Beta Propeller Repeat
MSEMKELLRRGGEGFAPREHVTESLIRRRARKDRNRRIAAAVLAIIVALVSFAALIRTFREVERPANEPTPRDMFARVHGWITYGNATGIWAVDPTRPGDPKDQIKLSDRQGEPLAWSSDGSNLLLWRLRKLKAKQGKTTWTGLFVLNADGTETRVATDKWTLGSAFHFIDPAGSFSPGASQVVYSDRGRIYVVDGEGGTRQLVLSPSRRRVPGDTYDRKLRTSLYEPTFSPDGRQIAYFDGMGDWGHSLRVMNADGSGIRVLIDLADVGHVDKLVWSPDGSHLAYSAQEGGIWIVGVDGSGLTKVIPDGVTPSWSPDGSRISYQPIDPSSSQRGTLEIAALDRTHVTHVREFGYGGSGPWNPLSLSESVDHEPTAAAGGAAYFVYAILALGIVGVLLLAWRARRRTAGR